MYDPLDPGPEVCMTSVDLWFFFYVELHQSVKFLIEIVIYGAYQVSHMKHATADKNMIGDVMQFVHFPVWNFLLKKQKYKFRGTEI